MANYKQLPYAIASYKSIRQEHYYYVDKTRYLPELEAAGRFLFLIRPRRFGKSSWLTVLESYYDTARQDEYELLFKDTYIDEHPTPEKHAYLILKFNFSQVDPNPDRVEASFQSYVEEKFFFFGRKYGKFLDDGYFHMMESRKAAHSKLRFLLDYISTSDLKLYILIDEYDNFANTILTTAGQAAYHELTHGAGFFRFFFNVLKGATDGVDTGIGRMFITGVSPVTMDDVTSGFNIGRNISLHPEFNELLGFSEQDVRQLLEYYSQQGVLSLPLDDMTAIMREWYDRYRFASTASVDLFNPDMILYCTKYLQELGNYPEEMIDPNVRIDYSKLRHLVVLNRQLNGNFNRLKEIAETGGITSKVVTSFPVERLLEPENFVSLLFYFGLLSYAGPDRLTVPNRTVKELMYGYLREGYRDGGVFTLDVFRFGQLMHNMAYNGEWEPAFRFLADEVQRQTSIRDYLTGEKVIQTFLLAYLNVTDYYLTRTEEELGKGFADLYLEPFRQKYRDAQHGYLIELKYVTRSEWSDEKGEEEVAEAVRQLTQYAADPRVNRLPRFTCIVLVFCSWELKIAQAVNVNSFSKTAQQTS